MVKTKPVYQVQLEIEVRANDPETAVERAISLVAAGSHRVTAMAREIQDIGTTGEIEVVSEWKEVEL